MSVGTNASPAGTANSRNARGNATALAARVPITVTTAAWSMKTSANCLPTTTSPAELTSHSAPAPTTPMRPSHQGLASTRANASRRRQASQRQIGTTTNPCVNVGERHQIDTIDSTVRQCSARIAPTARPTARSGLSDQLAGRTVIASAKRSVLSFIVTAAYHDLPLLLRCVVYPRLRAMYGPIALASSFGRRCQSEINIRYFGLSGLFCGIASRFSRRYS